MEGGGKPIRKKSSQGRGAALGMNPMMRGGSSHHKAMRRLEREEKRLWSRIKRIKESLGARRVHEAEGVKASRWRGAEKRSEMWGKFLCIIINIYRYYYH